MRRGNYRKTGWFVAKRSHGKKVWDPLALRDLSSLPLSSPGQSRRWVSSQTLPMVLCLLLLLSLFLSRLLFLLLMLLYFLSMLLLFILSSIFVEFQRYLCCRFLFFSLLFTYLMSVIVIFFYLSFVVLSSFCYFSCCSHSWYLSILLQNRIIWAWKILAKILHFLC